MFKINDNTAASQRIGIDNSIHVELGSATPSSELSVNGHPVLVSNTLAARTVLPSVMPRTTGSVSLSGPGASTTVSLATSAGFASASGNSIVVNFNSSLNQITAMANVNATSPQPISYASF
jgi:hypothetical protein